MPSGTTLFEVSLYDHDAPRYNHGGGKAANDGSGRIPAGAVRGNYDGPCPPYTHTYEFTITARDKEGKELGEASIKGEFPPSNK